MHLSASPDKALKDKKKSIHLKCHFIVQRSFLKIHEPREKYCGSMEKDPPNH